MIEKTKFAPGMQVRLNEEELEAWTLRVDAVEQDRVSVSIDGISVPVPARCLDALEPEVALAC
ncbi:MAG: hypothetical protein ACYS22_11100 [Planctomycetota bacterium]|jgi:hypothetical protein